jgi:CHAT domain-containing protein
MNLSQKKQKRFDDPYYWAAFTITGGYNWFPYET